MKVDPDKAYKPVRYDKFVLYAVRAFAEGTANDAQQKIAFEWIVRMASRHFDQSFHFGGIDGQRATDFMEGRRFVGLQILKMLQPEALAAITEKEPKNVND